MRTRRRLSRSALLLTLALVLAGCGGDKRFVRADLPTLVLQKDEAPKGTSYDAQGSGFQTLEEYAEEDQDKKSRFQDAGFTTSYFSQFVDPSIVGGQTGSYAVSFGMLFASSDGARRGLEALEDSVRAEGEGLDPQPAQGLGDASFGLEGVLERTLPGKPSGVLLAWREANAVFGVLAIGPKGTIGASAVRRLADVVASRTAAR